jgi:hypothetical protein
LKLWKFVFLVFILCIFFHWPFRKCVSLTPDCFLLRDSWGCHHMFCLETLFCANTLFRFCQEWHLQLPCLFMSMTWSSPSMHCVQTVEQNENDKQKLQKLTPDEMRPDSKGGVQQKSHFWGLDHWRDGCDAICKEVWTTDS